MSKRIALVIVGVLALVMFAGVACDDDDEPTVDEAEANVCDALDELETSLEDVRSLTVDSTVDEAEAAEEAVQSAVSDVQSAREELATAEVDAIQQAGDDLQSAIEGISGSDTLGEAADDVQAAVEGLGTSVEDAKASAGC